MRTIGIVGDSRGIGAALREQLLAQGHRVIGVSRSGVQRAAGDADNYQSLVFDAVAHPCDLSGFTDQLDGLVYCPGKHFLARAGLTQHQQPDISVPQSFGKAKSSPHDGVIRCQRI